MKIPEKITIAGIEYTISKIPSNHSDLDYGRLCGSCFFREGFIKIRDDMKPDNENQTLLHELTHLVCDALNISQETIVVDERFVESFSQLWYQIIKQL